MLQLTVKHEERIGNKKHNDKFISHNIETLARAAHLVDRECQRLGYEAIVRQRRSGAEFISVPSLIHNCSSLLALLGAGGSFGPGRSRSLPNAKSPQLLPLQSQQRPKPEAELLQQTQGNFFDRGFDAFCDSNSTPAMISTNSNHSKHRRSGWMKFFHRRRSTRKTEMAAAAAVAAAEKASTETELTADGYEKAAVETTTGDYSQHAAIEIKAERFGCERRQEESCMLYLRELLEHIHHSSERLLTLAGQESDEESAENGSQQMPHLTELQREVYYFQTRWPQTIQTISAKLTEVARTTKRLQQEAESKAKAEAGAKARSFAKMASMEAELRRLRTNLRRCHECKTRHPQQQKRLAAASNETQKRKQPIQTVQSSATPADGEGKVSNGL